MTALLAAFACAAIWYLVRLVRFWQARADYWFARAIRAEADDVFPAKAPFSNSRFGPRVVAERDS